MSEDRTNDRRKATDRRSSGDRRRASEGRRVMIEICQSQINLAIVAPESRGGNDLLLCRSHAWRVESTSLAAPGGAEELRLAFKQLAVEERLAGAATTVLLNGELCVNRVVIGSSNEIEQEISELTERSQLYLALGAGEKAAATSRFPLDARHEHAVLSVANRRTIDAVVKAAEGAGLELRAVEASAISLCRAHGELYQDDTPVMLVQLNEGSLEVALSHRGRLLLEHRTRGEISSQQLSEVLTHQRDRLVRYCRRQRIEGELKQALLIGDEAWVDEAFTQSNTESGLSIERFDVSRSGDHWDTRESLPSTQHAAVLGAALAQADSSASTGGPNLLERWIAESRKHIRPMLLRSAAPLAATLLIAVGLGVMNFNKHRENAQLKSQLTALAPAEARATTLRLKLLSTKNKFDELTNLAGQTPNTPINLLLQRVGQCLPDDVWLEQLQLTDGRTIEVRGSCYTDSGAYDFVSHLNRAPGIKQVALQETNATAGASGPTTSFRVKARFAPEALDTGESAVSATGNLGFPNHPKQRGGQPSRRARS